MIAVAAAVATLYDQDIGPLPAVSKQGSNIARLLVGLLHANTKRGRIVDLSPQNGRLGIQKME